MTALVMPVMVGVQRELSPQDRIHQLDTVVNLKALALALNAYAADFDGVYPNVKDIRTLKVVTYPYVKQRGDWDTANHGAEIRFNFSVAGVRRKELKEPSGDVLFYESKPWPDGRRSVSFADGGARILPAHDWAQASLSLLQRLPKVGSTLPESIGRTWKD